MFLKLLFLAILLTSTFAVPYGGLHSIKDNATSFTESLDAYDENNLTSLIAGTIGDSSGIAQGMFSRST